MEEFIKNIYQNVEIALDTVRPYLKADGGDVEIDSITDDYVLKLRLIGACESCPMSFMTMKAGIEQAIKKAVPEITSVEAINLVNQNSQ